MHAMLNPPAVPDPCARSSLRARRARTLHALGVAALAASLLGCSPALDWREAGPRDVDILMNFPCKPQTVSQPVTLAGQRLDMSMTGCQTAHMTFALAHADMRDGARVGAALAELHRAALRNIDARVLQRRRARVAHADGNLPDALELDLAGRGPQGDGLREHVLLFAQGAQVFQATVLGRDADFRADAAKTFTDSVQLGSPGA